MTNFFFHPSLLLQFLDPGSGIRDPGSGMGKNQDRRCSVRCGVAQLRCGVAQFGAALLSCGAALLSLVRRCSVGSASACCKAGPSSILGSAPQGGLSH